MTGGTGSVVRPIVPCKGSVCVHGLADTQAFADRIYNEFYLGWHSVKLPHKFKIGIGGCPNNCVKPGLHDFGIVGQSVPDYDEDSCNACKKCAVVAKCPVHAATPGRGRQPGHRLGEVHELRQVHRGLPVRQRRGEGAGLCGVHRRHLGQDAAPGHADRRHLQRRTR